jgi:hypothetical protein
MQKSINFKNAILVFLSIIFNRIETKCNLPNQCHIANVLNTISGQSSVHEKIKTISCEIKTSSIIEFNSSKYLTNLSDCELMQKDRYLYVNFKPPRFEKSQFHNAFGIYSLVDFINQFNAPIKFAFSSFNGFDLTNYNEPKIITRLKTRIEEILLIDSSLDFYLGKTQIKSCKDLIGSNITSPFQLFQEFSSPHFVVFKSRFRNKLCPLIFKNSRISRFIIDIVNTFYLKNSLSFTSDRIDNLNSIIGSIDIMGENLPIDLNLLNPHVFKAISVIYISGKVSYIHRDVFLALKRVNIIQINSHYMRSLMHSSGIEWIRNMNTNLNVTVEEIYRNSSILMNSKLIQLSCIYTNIELHFQEVFPDEDFCLYKDFPINQLIFILQFCKDMLNDYKPRYSCTYLWMVRHIDVFRSFKDLDPRLFYHIELIYESNEYKRMKSCNFDRKLNLCNKTQFKTKELYTYADLSDAMMMTKTVFNILSYITSIFGMITNLFVIVTISSKQNKEDFKGLKHYQYMRLNSIFNLSILIIHLSAWLNECVFPFQIFCPDFRKLLFFQYFKIIVQELFLTTLKFMNNFAYVAFALNRISLIGKDHNKLVKFVSDISIVKYTSLSFLLSILFSAIKFFKYRINNDQANFEYPVSYDYIINFFTKRKSLAYAYLAIDMVSDLLNYVVFLFVHLAIDIGMVVNLHRTLKEKLENFKVTTGSSSIYKEILEKKTKENETAVNNAIFMVVVNTTTNFFLKLPSLLYPIIFLTMSIYRKNIPRNIALYPTFGKFYYNVCVASHFCEAFVYISDFSYLFSIAIQIFFYNSFDKKFKNALSRIFK